MLRQESYPRIVVLALLAIVMLLAWLWPRERSEPNAVSTQANNAGKQPQPVTMQPAIPPEPAAESEKQPPPAVLPPPPMEVARAVGKRELQAYRIAVRGGVVSLDGQELIAGDFHRRRGPQAWMPGMWCVRLLDASMRVLAEETAVAPDEPCVVLDPQNLGANGKPRVTQYAGAGEDAMMQVRLPPHPEAKWLKVYRLSSLQRADWNTEPMGQLLAAISLP